MKIEERLRRCLPPRRADSHKGTYGTLLTVCGSYGMAGAAMLSARAALRSGVGLVACAVPEAIYPMAAVAVPEAVFAPYGEGQAISAAGPWLEKAAAVLAGCGLGRGADAGETVDWLLNDVQKPLVLDADGINAAARHIVKREAASAPLILTPHPAEMARLLHCTTEEVQRDREGAACAAARQWQAVAVLKGHRTVVADPSGVLFVNPTGNAGMATAGSGDVLAGMIASLLAQGLSAADAALCGVYLHGAAGDAAAARLSQRALIASDLIEALPELFLPFDR